MGGPADPPWRYISRDASVDALIELIFHDFVPFNICYVPLRPFLGAPASFAGAPLILLYVQAVEGGGGSEGEISFLSIVGNLESIESKKRINRESIENQ